LEEVGLGGGTTGEIVDAGNIRVDMFALILEADIVVCDFTILNANVFYELGIRHALRKKHTILIKGDPVADETPFDLLTDSYSLKDPGRSKDELVKTLRRSLAGERETDSPIFQMLPSLIAARPTCYFSQTPEVAGWWEPIAMRFRAIKPLPGTRHAVKSTFEVYAAKTIWSASSNG
jgi:hypothetical protein